MAKASAPRTSISRPRDEARALFRNAILGSAEHVFGERGFHAARIQDIAERARIAVGTVYNHFPQKDDLLRALLEERAHEMLAELLPRPEDPAVFESRLTARIGRLLRFVDQHRNFFAIALEHGLFGACPAASAITLGDKGVHLVERFRTAFENLVDEGLGEGCLEPVGRRRLVRLLGGLVRGVTVGAFEAEGPERLEDEAPIIVDLFLHGAGRRTRAAARARE
jgi:AcrR family transcriptional regulator